MQDPKTTETRSAFSLSCRVEVNIRAKPERVWKLLTDAKDFPRWNSTVTAIEGQIREGEQLRLHVPGTNRTFTPKVSGCCTLRAHDMDRRIRSTLQGRSHVRAEGAR